MDNQKIFLVIAIFLSVFLLWDQWEVQHTTDKNGRVVSQTQITGFASSAPNNNSSANIPNQPTQTQFAQNPASDVPSVSTTQIRLNLPKNPSPADYPFTTVTTDLLSVEISHKGGTIQSALLNAYPLTLEDTQKFQLLSNQNNTLFQAQSGLLPHNKLPTHHAAFSSEHADYQLEGETLTVPFVWRNDQGITVIKNFHFQRDSYVVSVDYQVTNDSNDALTLNSYTQLLRNPVEQGSRIMPTFTGGARYDDQDVYEKIDFEDFNSEPKTSSKGGWLAMVEHYFFAAWIPDKNSVHNFSASARGNNRLLTTVNPSVVIAAGASATLPGNDLYIGPKEHIRIGKLAAGLDKTVDYGILFIIAKPLSELLHWIYSWLGSWGGAIILLTILIKLAFYKLSEKSYRSMAGMRKLAPRLASLKETYGDDKQKLGQKTMALYKQEKINPASGCLPILVQVPVFLALYWVLLEMVELRQTPFGYLTDLSAQDPYYILPVIMGVSMFIQQKLNPPPPDPMQAKIMMSLPFVFTIFFLWFPSGLVLYWVVNNVLSIAQQWVINKRING